MDGPITIQPAATLRGFCQHVIAKYAGNWPPDEILVAGEFVTFFQLDFATTVRTLQELCKSLGINVSHNRLPVGLHGHNCAFEDKREIVIADTEGSPAVFGSREHTLLHELREIIEYEFVKVGSPVVTDLANREKRAEEFACYVRAEIPIKTLGDLLEHRGESKWSLGEVCFALIFGLAMVVYSFSCLILPHWEDQVAELNRRRYIRK